MGKHEKYVLILDSALYHASSMAKKFIESTKGHIKLIFLPKCTPQPNGIATQWRPVEGQLAGRYFKIIVEFRNAIRQIIRNEMKPVKVMDYITERYRPLVTVS